MLSHIHIQKIYELKEGGNYDAAAALEHNRDHLSTPSVDPKWGNREAKLPTCADWT